LALVVFISGALSSLAAGSNYEATILADHPVVYYRLGEPPGTAVAVDTSGNGHAGIYAGGVTLGLPGALAGDSDTSVAFDGTSGIVNSGIDLLSPSSTIEAWIRPTRSQGCSNASGCAAGHEIIAGTGGSFQLGFGINPQHVDVWLWPLGGTQYSDWRHIEASASIPLNSWTHVVTTWDNASKQLNIYINGVLNASTTLPGVVSSEQCPALCGGTSYTFTVGSFVGQQWYQGGIDEVAYYNSALPPDRILAHYKAGTNSALSAPINLSALQIGFSGNQIQLTWDYGSDPIDGFKIYRKAPLETWSSTPVAIIPVGLMPYGYPDTVPVAYGTFTYRVTAYKGADESANSNESTAFQIFYGTAVCTIDSNNNVHCGSVTPLLPGVAGEQAIVASFTPLTIPNVFLSDVAQDQDIGGYDHFDWISVVNHDPVADLGLVLDSNGNPVVVPYLDPPPGGYNYLSADSLPFYWNEVTGFSPGFYIFDANAGGDQHASQIAAFEDIPFSLPLGVGQYVGFFTTLVGVKGAVPANPSAPPNYTPLASFSWYTNFTKTSGGVWRRYNLDPGTGQGDGGIFNAQLVRIQDLPVAVRSLLIQTGAQGVTTAPKVDKDAPMTAAFLSGPKGTNGWLAGPVTVTLIATDIDGPSDIYGTGYTLDAGSLTAYTGPFTVSGDGIHTIEFSSVDRAGNIETPRPPQTIQIDGTPPAILCKANLNPERSRDGKAVEVTILGTMTDNTSGVDPSSPAYVVTDEDGRVLRRGGIALGTQGSYSFEVSLVPERNRADDHDRDLKVVVTGNDRAGNVGSCSAAVTRRKTRGSDDDHKDHE
jgi:hypothetical protein